ncbi:hypothetical protein BPMI_01512 [Candidatus Burkholderia pumila]|uniref:Sce7725 family protein n=1 Tax=Candidatus Burkholderia pumila TaxID=1090375 RepID=A0ABR5HL56_9BURK|nr:hypothetical protein BPMI_01512 [Candidatus Burkholderia pumila]
MYHPYFRGKQFELVTIREMAKLLAQKNFIPVIEPVRESLGSLKKTLSAVCDAGGCAIVIVNPYHGDHQEDGTSITGLLQENFKGANNISAGILLRSDMAVDEVIACYGQHADHHPVLIHAGFTEPKTLAAALEDGMPSLTNVFIEDHAKLLYRKHFDQSTSILVRDGFKRLRNADYPAMEEFSDFHVAYGDLGMTGFGNFLIGGDVYSEGGGPAYAVAIHLTFTVESLVKLLVQPVCVVIGGLMSASKPSFVVANSYRCNASLAWLEAR